MKERLIIAIGLLASYPIGILVGFIFGLSVERIYELKAVEHFLVFTLGVLTINLIFRFGTGGVEN